MADFEMDFQWPRATRYEIDDSRLAMFASNDQYRKNKRLFSDEDYDFEGAENVSQKIHIVADRLEHQFGFIVPIGPTKLIRPDSRSLDAAVEALLGLTGGIDITTVSIKRFRAHIAEITPTIMKIVASTGILIDRNRESPIYWYALAVTLNDYFEFRAENARAEMPTLIDLNLSLVSSINNGPTIAMRPATLADAILLHAARSIAAGTTFLCLRGLQDAIPERRQSRSWQEKSGRAILL